MQLQQACALCHASLSKRVSAEHPSEERLDREELRFMSDLVGLLEACHFRLLSEEDWDTAQAEEFTVRALAVASSAAETYPVTASLPPWQPVLACW